MAVNSLKNTHIALIREKVRLFDVVSKKIKLVKRGSNLYAGLCPFHSEHTASFNVNCENDMFYCFGCGAYGDVVQFVSDTEGLDFMRAIEYLAKAYNVDMSSIPTEKLDYTYVLMESAACWMSDNLAQAKAVLSYLYSRKITDNIIKKFRLGYVPVSGMKNYLLSSGKVTEKKLADAGLISKSGRDCLYDRVTFPICDTRGRVIAFGGRSLSSDHGPKYINSAENTLFKKRENLYGAHIAFYSARKLGKIIVVEGYMDVLILSQMGIENVVGLLGTAMTETHLKNMWGTAPEIIVWMDGDSAGVSASVKIAQLAVSMIKPGCSMRFVLGSKDKDPYDICVSYGVEHVKNLIESARLLSEFVMEYELSRLNIQGKIKPEQCALLEGRIKEYTSRISDGNIAKYYNSFFYQQIRALQSQGSDKNSWRGGGHKVDKACAAEKLNKVSLQTYVAENYQICAIQTILACPKLLDNAEIFEQFASMQFTGDMQLLQQHIVDIKEIHGGREFSREDLIGELCSRNKNFERILNSSKLKEGGFTLGKGQGDEDIARLRWEKLMLSRQLDQIQEQIVQLRLEGKDEIALNLSEHAREIDDKLRNLWRC